MTEFGSRDEFFAALRENRDRTDGRAKAAIAEEIVEAAEEFGDNEVTVSALVELMGALRGSGESVKLPVAFARLLKLWDQDRKYFDDYETHRLFWFFKWVNFGLLSTPDVPLASIRSWLEEMRRRYQEAGHDLQPVYSERYSLAVHLGEGEELAYELWATRGRTRLSDCAACEARSRGEFHIRAGEDERGLAEMAPTFEGRSTCDEEPHSSQAVALLPLIRLGRLDEARTAHLTGYRAVRGKEAYLEVVGLHLEFCALTGNEARGLELLAENRALFGFTSAPRRQLDFLTGVEVLLARLAETGHGATPCGGPIGREWTVSELRATVAAQTSELAARFDARNGNGTVSGRRQARLAVRPLVGELNLGVRSVALESTSDDAAAPVVTAAAAAAAPRAAAVSVPDDFTELLVQARQLDRQSHPAARTFWVAVIERVESGADAGAADEFVRGEIATELAYRACNERDWATAVTKFRDAATHYGAAGNAARVIASEARIAWGEATEGMERDAAGAAETVWPRLEELQDRISGLISVGFSTPELESDARGQQLVVRQSMVLTARNPALRGADAEVRKHWTGAMKRHAEAAIGEGVAAGRPDRVSLIHEVLAEYDATHGAPEAGEASARKALEIFTAQGWTWRMHRGRMLLGLSLAGQGKYAEAVAVVQTGLAEAHPDVDPDELTPLYRLLGEAALQGREFATAVRGFSEAAVRLDRGGDVFGAVETRWRMSNALAAQGSVADAVAVLETLVDVDLSGVDGAEEVEEDGSAADAATAADADDGSESAAVSAGDSIADEAADRASDSAEAVVDPALTSAKEPKRPELLNVQIRVDLAQGLLALGEPRDAAVEYLKAADIVSDWPDQTRLTAVAAAAAGALALSGNWDGARAALERALQSNTVAPRIPDLTEALRDMADEALKTRGPDALEESLAYLDQADRLRAEFPDASNEQFMSIEVDVAQCSYTRGRVLYNADHNEEALAAFEAAIEAYDRAGFATVPPRFEAIRMAAVVELNELARPEAARARLDKAVAEAEAAGHTQGAAILRQLRDSRR